MKLMPQLAFDGNCRQAFENYEKVFKGKITVMNALGDSPDVPLPPGSKPARTHPLRGTADGRLGAAGQRRAA